MRRQREMIQFPLAFAFPAALIALVASILATLSPETRDRVLIVCIVTLLGGVFGAAVGLLIADHRNPPS